MWNRYIRYKKEQKFGTVNTFFFFFFLTFIWVGELTTSNFSASLTLDILIIIGKLTYFCSKNTVVLTTM